jgi:hypothetical protein|tara:strand:+ start:2407 stop:2769 length:363 start_codon:yes stop_codon:yes gene_type:complete
MEELHIYPEGGANFLEPDAVVSVVKDGVTMEKMVSQLETGDSYTTKIKRQMHKRTVKQCIEEMLSRKISITYKFFPSTILVMTHITKGEILNFPIEEDLDVEDIQYIFNYVLDSVQEDEL